MPDSATDAAAAEWIAEVRTAGIDCRTKADTLQQWIKELTPHG